MDNTPMPLAADAVRGDTHLADTVPIDLHELRALLDEGGSVAL